MRVLGLAAAVRRQAIEFDKHVLWAEEWEDVEVPVNWARRAKRDELRERLKRNLEREKYGWRLGNEGFEWYDREGGTKC